LENDEVSDMTSGFTQVNNNSDISETIKQLFDNDKELERIFQITDLSQNEISLITRIWLIGEMKDIKQYKNLVRFFCQIKLSKDRSSRREVLRAIDGVNNQKQGFLSKMNPMNWGRR